MPKVKKILFVTPRLAVRPSDEAIHNELLDAFSESAEVTAPEKFPQPDYPPIQIPQEFQDDDLQADTFRLAVHEIGHALANLLYSGRVDAVVLTSSVTGGGVGRSYGNGGTGEDGARLCLGGLAAERLVEGTPLDLSGFTSDIEMARTDLRLVKVHEAAIDARAQELYLEVQRTFAKKWTTAILHAATALTKRGILDGKTLFELFSQAQEYAADAGLLKSFSNVVVGNGTGPSHIDTVKFRLKHFDALAKSIKLSNQADCLKKSLNEPGLSALEVVKRSVVAVHLQRRADLLGGE